MELFIIRHGQSIGNLIPEDMPDGELTELGRSQAAKVAECMGNSKLDYIISSPLVRALETAQPLARALNLPIHVWKNTFEVRNKGVYIGPTKEQLLVQFPEARFRDDFEEDGWYCSGDETEEDGNKRARKIYEELLEKYKGKRVGLFAHGGFNRHLLLVALGLDHTSPMYFHHSNGCIYWLSIGDKRAVLRYLGETRSFPDGYATEKVQLN